MEKIIVKRVQLIENVLWWQKKNLQYTKTGYGSKIPSRFMVRINNRFRRIYVSCFSNIGTPYVIVDGKNVIIDVRN